MPDAPAARSAHAVGIDLGTTYSCIAHLNEHGEPVTIPNQEGELSTPSVVLFDRGEAVVGTEALRNAIRLPDRVVQNAKRFLGVPDHFWEIGGRKYSPIDISALIIMRLLSDAERQIGRIEHAVITVPAQFSDRQRQAVSEAGTKAGLKRVDIINEPVAAALCYVLGTEGLWFSELAMAQQILVYDLGGGTFDLSLVKYQKDEIRVVASGGDLHLGGIDWNDALMKAVAHRFKKEFGADPRSDLVSRQYLAWEVEQTKRSLTVRPRSSLSCQHDGRRQTYQIEQEHFAKLTAPLVKRTEDITLQMLKDNRLGWANIDVVLTTGGASRMPMIRSMLKALSGRTLNTSLSPDQSIAHGATYYAGMLLSHDRSAGSNLTDAASARLSKMSQRSVNARELGILIRDPETNTRVPYYLIAANTPLPASSTQSFGTVIPNQKRVLLHIIEGGTRPDLPPVELGTCVINDLAPDLPPDSRIDVTIRYDESARVHVAAKDMTSGREATTQILRETNLIRQVAQHPEGGVALLRSAAKPAPHSKPAGSEPAGSSSPSAPAPAKSATKPSGTQPVKAPQAKPSAPKPPATGVPVTGAPASASDIDFQLPTNVCDVCGGPLTPSGACVKCRAPAPLPAKNGTAAPRAATPPSATPVGKVAPEKSKTAAKPVAQSVPSAATQASATPPVPPPPKPHDANRT